MRYLVKIKTSINYAIREVFTRDYKMEKVKSLLLDDKQAIIVTESHILSDKVNQKMIEKHFYSVMELNEDYVFKKGQMQSIESLVCLDGKKTNKRINNLVTLRDVIQEIQGEVGLDIIGGVLVGGATIRQVEFSKIFKSDGSVIDIKKAFRIAGQFCVVDPEKFHKAVSNGIGSRGSHGFGAINLLSNTCVDILPTL